MSATRQPVHERYGAPVEASRRGAHRARSAAVTTVFPVVAGLAVVTLVILGVFSLLGGDPETPGRRAAVAAPTATGSAAPTADPEAGDPPASAPSASADGGAGDGEAEEEKGAAAEVDKDVPLVVLNSVSVNGLASRTKTALEGDDWTVTRTGDSIERNRDTTTVYYGDAEDEASAEAVVETLGFGRVLRSAEIARKGITIVLGQDAA